MILKSICRKMIVPVALTFSAGAFADGLGSEAPVTESEMREFVAQSQAAGAETKNDATLGVISLVRCDAWSVAVPGSNFHWIGTNVYYARAQALGACQAAYGFTCRYWCQWTW